MDFKLPKEVTEVLEKVQKANFQIYIVGGAVRDLLLGRKIKDWDFTTNAKPEETLSLFPDAVYGNTFGTVVIPPKGKTYDRERGPSLFDITTMRKEGNYRDFRHPSNLSWTNSLEEDLGRRDFTINAMALDKDLRIHDPFLGKEDLKKKLIRAVGDPKTRFREDALRLIRAVRIAAQLEFEIEEKTFEALKQNASLIKDIAMERIRDELLKIMSTQNPEKGIAKLREAGLLQFILPELEACFGLQQEGPKHDRVYDIGEHSLLTLKYCPSKNPITKLAALLHDIGKPDTVSTDKTGNVTFYNHEVFGGKKILEISKRFNLSKVQQEKIFKLVRWHMFSVNENQTESAIRRFIRNIGKENIQDMIALRIGDRLGGGTQTAVSWRMEKFQERIKQVLKKPFSLSDLKLNGNDVMKILEIKPGPKVGKILNELFEEVLADSSKNNREYLLKRAHEKRTSS